MIKILVGGALFLTVCIPAGFAAPGSSDDSPSKISDSNYKLGEKAVEAENWIQAIRYLEKAVATDPKNADAWNYLAYSHRQQGNLEKAFQYYEEALTLDPRHKGAHEYVGEAYLQTKDLAKAEDHLQQLKEICGSCEEYQDLAEAIAEFKAKQ
jgi:Flp pilus assembly protein TadD